MAAPAPASPAASPATAATPRGGWLRKRSVRVAGVIILILFALLASQAWLVPHVLRDTLPAWLKSKTGRELRFGEVSFNPFTLRLRASDVALDDGGKPLARLAAADLQGSWATLVNLAWTADHVTLTRPEIDLRIAADGSLDWVRFLDAFPPSTEPPSDRVPRVLLHNLTIDNAAVRLQDGRPDATERKLDLSPISFKLDKLSTLPRDRGDYGLQATLNDQTRVQWKGRVGLNPIESSGDLVVSNLPVTRVQSLASLKLPVTVGGTINLSANYSVAVGTDFAAAGIGGGTLELVDASATHDKDRASVKTLKLTPLSASWAQTKAPGGGESQIFALLPFTATIAGISVASEGRKDPLLSIAQVATAQPVNMDIGSRRVEVPQIVVSDARLNAERGRDGTLLLPFAGVAAAAAPAGASAASSPAAAWTLNFTEIVADKAALVLRDSSFATPQTASALLDLTLGATVEAAARPVVRVSSKRLIAGDVALRDDGGKDAWLAVREVRAAPFAAEVTGTRIELPKIDITAPVVNLALDKDGLDLARKLAPATAPASATIAVAPAAGAGKPPAVSIAGVALAGGRATLVDSTLATTQTHVVDGIRVATERIELDGSRPIAATLDAALGSGGTLQAKLKYDLKRSQGEATAQIERVALAPLSPYLNRNTRLKLGKGEAAVSGTAKFSAAANAAEALRFDGKFAVRDLELQDETKQDMFAQWAELSSQDLRIVQGPAGLSVTLADLLLDQPRGKLIIAEDGTVNLTQIGKLDAATGAPVQAQKPVEAAPVPVDGKTAVTVKVDRLQVTGGDVDFADLSLRPQFGTRVSNLSGLIVGLSTEPASRAEISLEGKVDEYGLARVSGNLSPLGATEYTDIKAVFRNLEMRNLTPYSGKFAGRTIESGKLSLDLDYKVVARRLKGENQVIIDNLKLGERVESKDATSLPLDLAIALLSDSNGVIDLGLPVQGSLDDPQFSFGGLVWKTIVNVLTKIATAPFRALGALLGGSGEEFEAVMFEPGEARLLPPEREKIAKLAKALEQRPQLKLTIEGRFDRARDREALADNILKLEISKRAGMKPPGPNEPLIISFTDRKVQDALDELAAAAGEDAAKLRAKYLPPAGNAITGLIQNARETLTDKGRTEAADARGKYYPELFKLLHDRQAVPDAAYTTLADFRAEAIRSTLTAVNKFDAARVSVAAAQPVKASKANEVATTLALTVK